MPLIGERMMAFLMSVSMAVRLACDWRDLCYQLPDRREPA